MLDPVTGDLILHNRLISAEEIEDWRRHMTKNDQLLCLVFGESGQFLEICHFFQEEFHNYIINWNRRQQELENEPVLFLLIDPFQDTDQDFNTFWCELGAIISTMNLHAIRFMVSDNVALLALAMELIDPEGDHEDYYVEWRWGEYDECCREGFETAFACLRHCKSIYITNYPWDLSGALVSLSTLDQCETISVRTSAIDPLVFDENSISTFLMQCKCSTFILNDPNGCEASRLALAQALTEVQREDPIQEVTIATGLLDHCVFEALSSTSVMNTLSLRDVDMEEGKTMGPERTFFTTERKEWLCLLAQNPQIQVLLLQCCLASIDSLQCLADTIQKNNYTVVLLTVNIDLEGATIPDIIRLFETFSNSQNLYALVVCGEFDEFVGDDLEMRDRLRSEIVDLLMQNHILIAAYVDKYEGLFDRDTDWLENRLDAYLKLNKCGRKYMDKAFADPNKSIELLGHPDIRDNLDCLFSHLAENPKVVYGKYESFEAFKDDSEIEVE